jgi:predicted PhzF superfamily epimerase YddE/YHI9
VPEVPSGRVPFFIVDLFASSPFHGCPTPVVASGPLETSAMQAVTLELQHLDVAFLWPESGDVHIVTAGGEVPFSVRGVMASAHVLARHLRPDGPREFALRTPERSVRVRDDGERLALDLPARALEEAESPPALREALPGAWTLAGFDGLDYVALMRDERSLRAMRPDISALRRVRSRGVAITAPGDHSDFVVRYFGPNSGIEYEDSVTASIFRHLGPYWAGRLGRNRLRAVQASPRGGSVDVEVSGDVVRVGGPCVTSAEGTIRLR